MNAAVFLDRDGVINYPVFNTSTNEYEAPFKPEDFKLFPDVIESLRELINLGYKLFLISNQPDYAKGKTSLENLKLVHEKMHSIFTKENIKFFEYFYCYHRIGGIVPEYSIKCECRKPGNLFLRQAKEKYSLDLAKSWMIGDRDVDIYCGQSLAVKTILITLKHSESHASQSKPDFKAEDLQRAVGIIKKCYQ